MAKYTCNKKLNLDSDYMYERNCWYISYWIGIALPNTSVPNTQKCKKYVHVYIYCNIHIVTAILLIINWHMSENK